jgi:hypothetical protein
MNTSPEEPINSENQHDLYQLYLRLSSDPYFNRKVFFEFSAGKKHQIECFAYGKNEECLGTIDNLEQEFRVTSPSHVMTFDKTMLELKTYKPLTDNEKRKLGTDLFEVLHDYFGCTHIPSPPVQDKKQFFSKARPAILPNK